MTLRLSRHQRLEICRLRSGHLLLLCWTLAPVEQSGGRVRADWVWRVLWCWSRDQQMAADLRAVTPADLERVLTMHTAEGR